MAPKPNERFAVPTQTVSELSTPAALGAGSIAPRPASRQPTASDKGSGRKRYADI